MSDIEALVISKAISEETILPLLDRGMGVTFFPSERWSKVWAWLREYWDRNGQVPTLAAYQRQWPSYKLPPAEDEPFSGLLDELSMRRRRLILSEGMQKFVDAFDEGETDASVHVLQQTLAQVDVETAAAAVTKSSDFIGAAVLEAVNRKSMSIIGIPTGFPTIDEATGGLQREQLVNLIALPKRGKSSILLAMALAVQRHGETALVCSIEMSNEEWKTRYLSVGAGVSLTGLMRGRLTDAEKSKLYAFEEEVVDLPDLILVHDVTATMTVGAFGAKIKQHRPRVAFLDGVYFMHDEMGEKQGSPQALTNITRGLKRLAQSEAIPIVGSTQALFSRTTASKGVQMDSIGYTSSFAQDSDVLLGLDREDLTIPRAKLKVIAARNAVGTEVDISLDYSFGHIAEESGGSYADYAMHMGDD